MWLEKTCIFYCSFTTNAKINVFWARFQLKIRKRKEKIALIKNPLIFDRLLNYEKKFRKNVVWPLPRKSGIFRENFFEGRPYNNSTCTYEVSSTYTNFFAIYFFQKWKTLIIFVGNPWFFLARRAPIFIGVLKKLGKFRKFWKEESEKIDFLLCFPWVSPAKSFKAPLRKNCALNPLRTIRTKDLLTTYGRNTQWNP